MRTLTSLSWMVPMSSLSGIKLSHQIGKTFWENLSYIPVRRWITYILMQNTIRYLVKISMKLFWWKGLLEFSYISQNKYEVVFIRVLIRQKKTPNRALLPCVEQQKPNPTNQTLLGNTTICSPVLGVSRSNESANTSAYSHWPLLNIGIISRTII